MFTRLQTSSKLQTAWTIDFTLYELSNDPFTNLYDKYIDRPKLIEKKTVEHIVPPPYYFDVGIIKHFTTCRNEYINE